MKRAFILSMSFYLIMGFSLYGLETRFVTNE